MIIKFITINEDQEIHGWPDWQSSWDEEYESDVLDIIALAGPKMYCGSGEWSEIPTVTLPDK